MGQKLIPIVRITAGLIFLINGLNWWVKLITPYPSQSDFINYLPPPDVVGAMIENGVLFFMVKASELAVGVALLSNRFVPAALVAAVPITIPVFVVDVFFIAHLRGQVMGWGSLILNFYLIAAYLGHYRQLLAASGDPASDSRIKGASQPSWLADKLASLFNSVAAPFGIFALLTGLLMLGWLLVMMVQHQINPMALSDLFPLEPRI